MSISSSWIHGNALTIESPIMFEFNYDKQEKEEIGRLVLTPSGPGAWVRSERGGEASWCHLPIPTINANVSPLERFELLRVFLLFSCDFAQVHDVHVYDGSERIAKFKAGMPGSYLVRGSENTFHFWKPHEVKSGISLSFLFTANILGDLPHGWLYVAAAGADFRTSSRLFSLFFSR